MLNYPIEQGLLDEVYQQENGSRPIYHKIIEKFNQFSESDIRTFSENAKLSFFNQGITFSVYSEKDVGVERIFPFDIFPRIIPNKEWEQLEKGLKQRNEALNLFLWDLY